MQENRVFGTWKKHTHTHSVDCSPGCLLGSTNRIRSSWFFDFVASSQHATRRFCTCMDGQRVWHPRVCENTCCEYMSGYSYVPSEQLEIETRRIHHFHPFFLLSIVEILLAVLSFDEESIEFVQKTRYIHIFIRKRWIITLLTFVFNFKKEKSYCSIDGANDVSRTSYLLVLTFTISCAARVYYRFSFTKPCAAYGVRERPLTSAHYVARWRRQAACISKKRKNRKGKRAMLCICVYRSNCRGCFDPVNECIHIQYSCPESTNRVERSVS